MKGSEVVDDLFPLPLPSRFFFTAAWRWWKFFDSYAMPPWPKVQPWAEYISKKEQKNKRRIKKKLKGVKEQEPI